MSQRRHLIAGALACLMTTSAPSSASEYYSQQEAVSGELMEAFIGLRIGQGGSSFYRVMVDHDENPYIAINSFLEHMLGIKAKCSKLPLFCTVILPGESDPRWIDGQNFRMSDAETGQGIALNPHHILLKDDTIWLQYKALEKWLPLRAVWSLKSYQISINPFFQLPKDLIDQRGRNRLREQELKALRKDDVADDVIQVPSSGTTFYEARGELQASGSSNQDPEAKLSFDVGADVLQGRLQAGGVASEKETDPLEYWQYERFGNAFGEYFALGQVFYEGDLTSHSRVLTEGYRVMRTYQNEGSGAFTLNATVPEEATVDVYKNGFYEDTVVADKLGQIVLRDIQASSGDVITLRSISKEGIESEQSFVISGSYNQYLDPDDWDYEIIGGADENGSIHALSFRYGGASNLTAGLTVKKVVNKDAGEVSALASLAVRPHHRISFQWQQELGKSNWAYSSDISLWSTHNLRLFGKNVKDNDDGSGSTSPESSVHGLEHKWGSSQVQTQTLFTDSDHERRFREKLGVKIRNRWDLIAQAERTWDKKAEEVSDSWAVKQIYALPNGSRFEAGLSGGDAQRRWFGSMRWLGETESPWSERVGDNRYSVTASVHGSQGGVEPTIGLQWHHEDSISGSMSLARDSWQADVTFRFGAAKKSGRHQEAWHKQSWEYFRQGTVHGRLLAPTTSDGEERPLSDTTIWVSNYRAVTDENGDFVVEGLPVNQPLKVRVDMGSLAIDTMPEKEAWKISLRPGTALEFNPPMIWSVGIDGYVHEESFETNMSLVFRHETLGVLADIPVEPDGFFVTEKLSPGAYSVDLIYPDKETQYAALKIGKDQTWVSDVKISAE